MGEGGERNKESRGRGERGREREKKERGVKEGGRERGWGRERERYRQTDKRTKNEFENAYG